MKNNKILLRIFACSCVLLLFACSKSSNNIELSSINPSLLRDTLPVFEKEAKQWHEDAFLQDLDINLNKIDQYKVRAIYLSPTFSNEQLGITLTKEGEIITKEYKTTSSYHYTNIEDIEWKIDADEALKIMLNHDEQARKIFTSNQKHCSEISFTRFRTQIKNPPVVWTLSVFDCYSHLRYIDLNPITGEIINTPEE